MIKKFDQYNESIRDKMTPKSDEDVKIALDKRLDDIKNQIKNGEIKTWELVSKLLSIEGVDNARDVIDILIDSDVVNVHTLISLIQTSIDNEHGGYSKEYQQLNIFDILIDNKDKINPE